MAKKRTFVQLSEMEQIPSESIEDCPPHYPNHYHHNFVCMNCGKNNPRWVLKGVTIEEVLPFECRNCGCSVKELRWFGEGDGTANGLKA